MIIELISGRELYLKAETVAEELQINLILGRLYEDHIAFHHEYESATISIPLKRKCCED